MPEISLSAAFDVFKYGFDELSFNEKIKFFVFIFCSSIITTLILNNIYDEQRTFEVVKLFFLMFFITCIFMFLYIVLVLIIIV